MSSTRSTLSLPAYWVSKKDFLERTLQHKREKEARNRQSWDNTARYFDLVQLKAVKHDSWTSDEMSRMSADGYRRRQSKARKFLELEARRQRLAQFLAEEQATFQDELKETYQKRKSSVRQSARSGFVSRDEIENGHLMQDLDSDRESESSTEKELEFLTQRSQESDDVIDAHETSPKNGIREQFAENGKTVYSEALLQQIAELKKRDEQTMKLKKEAERLQLRKWQLEQADEDKRNKLQILEKQKDYGSRLRHQYKTQLQLRAKEIMEELKDDETWLQKLDEQGHVNGENGYKIESKYSAAQKAIVDQIRLEMLRQEDTGTLFNEEAGRVWRAREIEWHQERGQRQKLMDEVMQGLKSQLDDKLNANLSWQKRLIREREQLLQEIECLKDDDRVQNELDSKRKESQRFDLDAQVADKTSRDRESIQRSAREQKVKERLLTPMERLNLDGIASPRSSRLPSRASVASKEDGKSRRVAWA